MFESIVREHPLLAGIGAAVIAVFLFLVVSAILSGRSRRQVPPPRPYREPTFERGGGDRYDAGEPHRRPADRQYEPVRERRGLGFGALLLVFIIGLGAGAFALAFASTGDLRGAVATIIDSAERGYARISGSPVTAPSIGDQSVAEPPATAAPAAIPGSLSGTSDHPPADLKARLAAFADSLKGKLPVEAGPEFALTSVEVEGTTIHLGYTVARAMDRSETAEFDGYIMRTAKSLFCAKQATEIRALSQNGVLFHLTYADPGGQTLARFTVPPGFCD